MSVDQYLRQLTIIQYVCTSSKQLDSDKLAVSKVLPRPRTVFFTHFLHEAILLSSTRSKFQGTSFKPPSREQDDQRPKNLAGLDRLHHRDRAVCKSLLERRAAVQSLAFHWQVAGHHQQQHRPRELSSVLHPAA